MQPPFFNDQAYFAETYLLEEDYTGQMARLAYFKINSWKRTQAENQPAPNRTELRKNLQETLLRSVKPMQVLVNLRFFDTSLAN